MVFYFIDSYFCSGDKSPSGSGTQETVNSSIRIGILKSKSHN
jgi:hypothetical protein